MCTPVQACADRRLTANGTEVIPKPVNERRSLWPKHQRISLVRELLSQHAHVDCEGRLEEQRRQEDDQ